MSKSVNLKLVKRKKSKEDIIDILSEALNKARRGEVIGVCIISVFPSDTIEGNYAVEDASLIPNLYLAVKRMERNLEGCLIDRGKL